jgi:hypothetical protein
MKRLQTFLLLVTILTSFFVSGCALGEGTRYPHFTYMNIDNEKSTLLITINTSNKMDHPLEIYFDFDRDGEANYLVTCSDTAFSVYQKDSFTYREVTGGGILLEADEFHYTFSVEKSSLGLDNGGDPNFFFFIRDRTLNKRYPEEGYYRYN